MKRHASSQKITYIAKELIRTESSYIAQLREMIEHYQKPLSRIASNKSGPVHMTQSEISRVFDNIELLLGVNTQLFTRLKQPDANIGQTFHDLAPLLKMYTSYFRCSEEAMDIVHNAMETRPAFQKFCLAQESDLEGLLVRPAQRITQYRLFLCELLKRTPEDQDTTMLEKGIDAVSAAAEHCNNDMKRLKQMHEWKKLVARFGDQLPFSPQRTLIMSENLIKVSHKGVHEPKLVLLFSDALAYGHDDVLGSGKTVLDQVFSFPHVQTRKGLIPLSVQVLTPRKTFSLLVSSAKKQVRRTHFVQECTGQKVVLKSTKIARTLNRTAHRGLFPHRLNKYDEL